MGAYKADLKPEFIRKKDVLENYEKFIEWSDAQIINDKLEREAKRQQSLKLAQKVATLTEKEKELHLKYGNDSKLLQKHLKALYPSRARSRSVVGHLLSSIQQ